MTKPKPRPTSKSQLLRRQPETFRRLSGLSVEKFDELRHQLEPLYRAAEIKRRVRPHRQRAIGGGNAYKLNLEDRLLMLLMYYRLYITHAFLGFLWNLDDSNVGRNLRPLEPLLAQIFQIPERRIKRITMEPDEVAQLFFDATEQPIQRPKGKTQQKRHYSGKKKRHTIKHQVVTDDKAKIQAVSPSYAGSVHDKKVYDNERVPVPPGVQGTGDSGYQGTALRVPHKKPKGGALSDEQKAANRTQASERIVVEHSIGKMKIFKILAERFRNALSRHTLIFKNVAGLTNLMFA
jgi:DDE superfamily endonuclease/Helix-turn-helix of DDE superfamily endonuclease